MCYRTLKDSSCNTTSTMQRRANQNSSSIELWKSFTPEQSIFERTDLKRGSESRLYSVKQYCEAGKQGKAASERHACDPKEHFLIIRFLATFNLACETRNVHKRQSCSFTANMCRRNYQLLEQMHVCRRPPTTICRIRVHLKHKVW